MTPTHVMLTTELCTARNDTATKGITAARTHMQRGCQRSISRPAPGPASARSTQGPLMRPSRKRSTRLCRARQGLAGPLAANTRVSRPGRPPALVWHRLCAWRHVLGRDGRLGCCLCLGHCACGHTDTAASAWARRRTRTCEAARCDASKGGCSCAVRLASPVLTRSSPLARQRST